MAVRPSSVSPLSSVFLLHPFLVFVCLYQVNFHTHLTNTAALPLARARCKPADTILELVASNVPVSMVLFWSGPGSSDL